MSDSDDDVKSVQLPEERAESALSDEKPAKKPRKVTEKMRVACQANAAKAREARAKKKIAKLAAEDEKQSILDELVASQKAKKKKIKEDADDAPSIFGEQRACALPPEKPSSRQRKHASPSESESEESEASEESEDSEVEFMIVPAKKKNAPAKVEKSGKKEKKSAIMDELEALKAELASLRKEKKKSKNAPVNVYVGGRQAERKSSALDAKVQWD